MCHYLPLLIRSCFWILTIHKTRIKKKSPWKNVFESGQEIYKQWRAYGIKQQREGMIKVALVLFSFCTTMLFLFVCLWQLSIYFFRYRFFSEVNRTNKKTKGHRKNRKGLVDTISAMHKRLLCYCKLNPKDCLCNNSNQFPYFEVCLPLGLREQLPKDTTYLNSK